MFNIATLSSSALFNCIFIYHKVKPQNLTKAEFNELSKYARVVLRKLDRNFYPLCDGDNLYPEAKFVIDSQGKMTQYSIIKEHTFNPIYKKITVSEIETSAPYDPLPKSIDKLTVYFRYDLYDVIYYPSNRPICNKVIITSDEEDLTNVEKAIDVLNYCYDEISDKSENDKSDKDSATANKLEKDKSDKETASDNKSEKDKSKEDNKDEIKPFSINKFIKLYDHSNP